MKIRISIILGLLVLTSSCVDINGNYANKYAQAGYNSVQTGDWKNAQIYYSRACDFGKSAGIDDLDKNAMAKMAIYKYEYGRASGVLCEWEEAEKALNEAYTIDQNFNGPVWMSLVELERMSIAQKDYNKASRYFDKLMPSLEKLTQI